MRRLARRGGARERRMGAPGRAEIQSDGLEYHPSIKEMPAHDRPRERLYYQGPAALKEEELVAIILRTGTREAPVLELARRLLTHYGGLGGPASRAPGEPRRYPGPGMAQAVGPPARPQPGRR